MTLGIPRLRELFMTAAQSIKTPVMTLPMRPGMANPQATELANRLRRIRLAEVQYLLPAWHDACSMHWRLTMVHACICVKLELCYTS